MASFQWYIVISTGRTGFTTTNQTFDSQNVTTVHITIFLLFQEITYFCIFLIDNLICTVIEELVESVDEMHETNYFFVANGDITGSFVSYVYFMFLLYQTTKRTTHRNNVIIRMRRENDYTFRIRFCTFRTVGVISIRFATRPSGNGVL